jgi:hypothetical protein
VLEQYDGAAWQQRATLIPSGTIMLFRQAAAPTGWTRQVDATRTDSVIRVLLNSEALADGGSWTVSGLSFAGNALPGHQHQEGIIFNGGQDNWVDAPFGTVAASGSTGHAASIAADASLRSLTQSVSAGTPSGTVSQDGSWRPKHVDVIAATKD